MNAQYLIRSIVALTMTSVIAVGCSGGGQSDETPQFQSPNGRTVTNPPPTSTVGGNEDLSGDNQEILDEIMRNREAINAAKASADAAKASADASKTSADEAKAKAEEAAENGKKAEKAAKKAGDKAEIAAWVAGITGALAMITSAVGDRIVYKNDDENRDKVLGQMKKDHEEDMGAHGGTQGVAIRNQEVVTAAAAVTADTYEEVRKQGKQINQGLQTGASTNALVRLAAETSQKFQGEVRQAFAKQANDREALLAQITALETRLASIEGQSERIDALRADLASLKELVQNADEKNQQQSEDLANQLAEFKASLEALAVEPATPTAVAQGSDAVEAEVPPSEGASTPEGESETFREDDAAQAPVAGS